MKTTFISPTGDISDARYMRIPLGFLYVASVLEQMGHDIKVICVDLFLFSDEKVKELIKSNSPKVVGITTVTCNYKNGAKYAKMVKEIDKNIKVVIGGIHVSFTYFETLNEYPDVDYVIIGEGEITAKELWSLFEKYGEKEIPEEELKKIKGIAFRSRDGELIKTEPREFVKDLDTLPYPARHLVSVSGYKKFNSEAHIFASRGCPHKCKFCVLPKSEGSFRKRSASSVVDEIEYLYNEYQYKIFKFVDNSFSSHKKTINEICDEIKQRDLNILWRCQTRVDFLNYELMQQMKKAGCEEILVGIESASERILNTIYDKKLSVKDIRNIFKIGKELGIVITPSFILGHPDETPEELEETKKLIIDLYSENYRHPRMCYLTPFPGSEVYDDIINGDMKKYLEEMDWDRYTHICPTLRTKYMSRHELARLYVEILAEITAANKERMMRIWPDTELDINKYYKPKIDLYRMKEAIIDKNVMRLNLLSEKN